MTGSKSVNTIQSSVNRVQAIHGFFPILHQIKDNLNTLMYADQ